LYEHLVQACYHKEKMWGSKGEEWGTNASSTTVEVVASRLVTEFPNAAFEFRRLFGHVLLSSNGQEILVKGITLKMLRITVVQLLIILRNF